MTFVRQILLGTVWFSFLGLPTFGATVYFGEDINSTATGQNEDAQRIAHPNSDAANSAFRAALSNVEVEDFESFTGNSNVTTLSFGPDTATLSEPLTVLSIPSGNFNGVYPISGSQTLLQSALSVNSFSVSFSSPQAAFGFYATDIEVSGNLTLRFLLTDGVSFLDRPVPTLAGQMSANPTGSVAFYGVIDPDNPFTRVTFIRTLNSLDGFGFDDMVIARPEQVVPEPAASWLVLGGAGLLLRRRRS